MSHTLFIDDGRIQRELVLAGTTLVGRDPECEISHADPRLSRRHAEFRLTPDGVVLRDLGSRNGTHVNGQPIAEAVLRSGDVVQIAHLTIQFTDTAAAPTVHMPRAAARAVGRVPGAPAAPAPDDRTRVVAPGQAAAAQAQTALDIPLPALDDRTRVKLAPSGTRPMPPAARAAPPPPSPPQPARVMPSTATLSTSTMEELGEMVIRDVPLAQPAAPPAPPVDFSVFGLAATAWGRQVLIQGLALTLLVLLLTAVPLLAWEVRLYGSSAIASWPVLLPVVVAAAAAGVSVASLIARTTARGLSSRGR